MCISLWSCFSCLALNWNLQTCVFVCCHALISEWLLFSYVSGLMCMHVCVCVCVCKWEHKKGVCPTKSAPSASPFPFFLPLLSCTGSLPLAQSRLAAPESHVMQLHALKGSNKTFQNWETSCKGRERGRERERIRGGEWVWKCKSVSVRGRDGEQKELQTKTSCLPCGDLISVLEGYFKLYAGQYFCKKFNKRWVWREQCEKEEDGKNCIHFAQAD